MRMRTGRWAWLLALGLALAPGAARGQEVPPPPDYPLLNILPIGGPRYEDGGFFLAGEFLFMQQTNPIRHQAIAFRGYIDQNGSLTGTPGTFVGSGTTALDTNAVSGPGTFQPGLAITAGWRFKNGVVVEGLWWHLSDARYSATAATIPPPGATNNLNDFVMTSPVFGFPFTFSGPPENFSTGPVPANKANLVLSATYGIYNASDIQTIDFVQRFDMGGIQFRIPFFQTDCWRSYWVVGGRAIVMWERFRWRVTDFAQGDVNGDGTLDSGNFTPLDTAQYSNVVSNRLYGAWLGCGNDWYWGSSPIGAFAASIDVGGSLMVDIVKERARYELPDALTVPILLPVASRARNEYTLAPVLQGDFALWWYPYQGIQCQLGWNFLAMFNTVASPHPVDFNYGAIAPEWADGITRVLHGFHAGIGFSF